MAWWIYNSPGHIRKAIMTYTYIKRYFIIEVLLTGIISIAALLLCTTWAIMGIYPPLMVLIDIAAIYQIWNTFIAIANPEQVTLDDEELSFSCWGRTDSYRLSEIKELRIREFPSAGKMYLRINNHNLLHGRYWLQTKQMENGKELFQRLLDLEYQLHPDTLKARARRVNTEYIKAEQRKGK